MGYDFEPLCFGPVWRRVGIFSLLFYRVTNKPHWSILFRGRKKAVCAAVKGLSTHHTAYRHNHTQSQMRCIWIQLSSLLIVENADRWRRASLWPLNIYCTTFVVLPHCGPAPKRRQQRTCLKRRHVYVAVWPSGRVAEINPFLISIIKILYQFIEIRHKKISPTFFFVKMTPD